MSEWLATCNCGWEADESNESHYAAVEKAVDHRIRTPDGGHETEIVDVDDD